jgi:hypothetical protein
MMAKTKKQFFYSIYVSASSGDCYWTVIEGTCHDKGGKCFEEFPLLDEGGMLVVNEDVLRKMLGGKKENEKNLRELVLTEMGYDPDEFEGEDG